MLLVLTSDVGTEYTVEPLCSRHPWDKYKCPDYRDVLISGVNLYYKAQFGTFVSVLNTGVSSFQGVLRFRYIPIRKPFNVSHIINCVWFSCSIIYNDMTDVYIVLQFINLEYICVCVSL